MDNVICLGLYCCLLVALYGVCTEAQPYSPSVAATLQSDLLANYSKKNRPFNMTYVDIQLGLMHITELNIVDQRLHVVGFIIAHWTDDRLKWNSSSYDGMEGMYIYASDIWTPQLLLNNAADKIQIINDDSDLASMNAYVAYIGYVSWLVPANFESQCSINIKFYPFDSQECAISVSSWLFLKAHLQLVGTFASINLDIYSENGEWDIISTDIKNVTRVLMGFELPAVTFVLKLQRKYSYYLLNMLLPVIILATMAPFVFILPIESGEKIGYALTILLSLSVVMTLVSDNIPPTSTNVCILSVYLLLTFIICSLITVVVVITCRCHNFHQLGGPMGCRMQTVTRFLVKLTMRSGFYVERDHKHDRHEDTTSINHFSNYTKSAAKENGVDQNKKIAMPNADTRQAWNEKKHDAVEDKPEKPRQREYTWEDFSVTFDKFNFFFTTVMTAMVTLGCMVALRAGGDSS